MVLPLIGLAVSAFGVLSARSAANKQAAAEKAAGLAEAKQYINDMRLIKAQAIDAGNQRLRDMRSAESQNIAAFAAMGRDDRSVDAFLKRNRDIAYQDIQRIEAKGELEAARALTAAAVAKEYGVNKAAGIRSSANANLLTGLGQMVQNIPYVPKVPSPYAPTTSIRPPIKG